MNKGESHGSTCHWGWRRSLGQLRPKGRIMKFKRYTEIGFKRLWS